MAAGSTKTIGLTGSIGMGKTTTSKIFKQLGVPVFDSDAAVHKLLGPDGNAVDEVEKEFPGVKQGNQIDRKKLGGRVFSDEAALEKLEAILHPKVSIMRQNFTDDQDTDLVLFDIPLLFEKGFEHEVDYTIVVTAPFAVQEKRVMARDGMTKDRFQDILRKQMPDEEKRKRADFILHTDQGLDYAKEQAENILRKIREK